MQRNHGSFRDPDGYVFTRGGAVYRHLAPSVREDYEHLISSGLYEELSSAGLLVAHEEEPDAESLSPGAWKVLRPQPVPFISWPYEWSFSQLRRAALLTLEIARRALAKGMVLKDASAYNVQFIGARALFIDTLSLTRWQEGAPWAGYRQFCEHFLAPLALAAYRDPRFLSLQRVHLDGVPLDLASNTLPRRTKLHPGLLAHLHLHAGFQKKHADTGTSARPNKAAMSRRGLEGIFDNLESTIRKLKPLRRGSAWADYYDETNYDEESFEAKKELVRSFLKESRPRIVWDMGANTGVFSAVVAEKDERIVIAMEGDEAASDRHFLQREEERHTRILPLVMDLANPSPQLGWNQRERAGLAERGPADCVMALALVHHLAIGNNLPLGHLAEAFAGWGKHLIVEFVPKDDSQTQRLLASRQDIFPDYTEEGFRDAFSQQFEIVRAERVGNSKRTLFMMKRRTR